MKLEYAKLVARVLWRCLVRSMSPLDTSEIFYLISIGCLMPDGATHLAYLEHRRTPVLLLASPLVGLGLNGDLPWWIGILTYVGYYVGYSYLSRYLDPDSDQLSLTSSEGRLMRELGILGFLVVWWMLPYAYIMKWFGGHRGLAHVHILGTMTRVLWAFCPALWAWHWPRRPVSR